MGAGRRISSNVVVPGVTRTEAWYRLGKERGVEGDSLLSDMAEAVAPMGEMQPSDVGEVVSFLASEKGRWITGLSLPADGGVHLLA